MIFRILDLADDWQGLYIDGVLVYENHSIHADDVLRWGLKLKDYSISYEDYPSLDKHAYEVGRCPQTWEEVLKLIDKEG